MKRKIIQVGSSRGVLIPNEVTKAMGWEFGSLTELTIHEDENAITLVSLKEEIPEDLDEEQFIELKELANQHKDILEGLND